MTCIAAGGTGASSNQCDETYTGPSAFSDPETKLIADFILERKDEIKMYLSFHSYGQWLLYAWSYSNADHADTALIHELCQLTADRIKTVHGTEYTPQRSFDLCNIRRNSSVKIQSDSHRTIRLALQISTTEPALIGHTARRESNYR